VGVETGVAFRTMNNRFYSPTNIITVKKWDRVNRNIERRKQIFGKLTMISQMENCPIFANIFLGYHLAPLNDGAEKRQSAKEIVSV
jgi:hypothetical protein